MLLYSKSLNCFDINYTCICASCHTVFRDENCDQPDSLSSTKSAKNEHVLKHSLLHMYCKLDSPSCEKDLDRHGLQMIGLHQKTWYRINNHITHYVLVGGALEAYDT